MSTFKKLASDTALYGISTIAARSINFFLTPIQTYAFKTAGTLASNVTLYAWIGVLLTLYTLGLETAFFRFAARNKGVENEAERTLVFSRTLTIVAAISVVATALILLFVTPIANALGYPGQEQFIQWTALLVGIDSLMAIPFARLRVEGKARQFVVAKLINIGLNVALNVFFIVVCKDITEGDYLPGLRPLAQFFYRPEIGPGYILLANLLANALYFVVLRRAFRGFRFTFEWPEAKTLVFYAFPIMLTGLAAVLNSLTDRLFLRQFLPNGFYPGRSADWALDIYGQCFKLSVFISLAIQSFKFAAEPFFFGQAENKNAPDLLARALVEHEHPQVAALVLAHLDPPIAADVLQLLDEELQPELVHRVATLGPVSSEALEDLERVLLKQVAHTSRGTSSKRGGASEAAKIVNNTRKLAEARIIKALARLDKGLARTIEDEMFVFDNLMAVDEKGLGTLLRAVENDTLVIALKGAAPALRMKMLGCMSARAAQSIQDEIAEKGPMRLAEVQDAQKEILAIARRLAEAGTIMLAGKGDDYV